MISGKMKARVLIVSVLLGGLLSGCQEPRPATLHFDWDSFVRAENGSYTPSAMPPQPRPAPVYTPEPVRPVARPEVVTGETLAPVPQSRPVQHARVRPASVPDDTQSLRSQSQPEDAAVEDTANLPRPRHAPARPAVAAEDSASSASAAAPAEAEDRPARAAKTASATPFSGSEHFRWPLRGTVIADFGASADGERNDGINIAVPAGTPITASADGTVGYAGGDMKSYGNLVVLRHDGNYFTAYAHADKLLVKTGDHVKAGQTIGYAGQTGDVDSPQLHFEIRKGHEPVDPRKFLSAKG